MRRAVLLLAALAGFWGGGYDDPVAAVGALHEISAGSIASPAAFVRSAPALVVAIPENGSGPAPRASATGSHGRASDDSFSHDAADRDAVFPARLTEHRQFATPHALARAGLLSAPATAPPSFQII